MDKQIITEIIEKSIHDLSFKCRPTIAEMHTSLDSMSQEEKNTYFKYAVNGSIWGGRLIEEYQNALESGDEDEIFKYERRIFEDLGKKQRKNIKKYLMDFDMDDYDSDTDVGYPNRNRGKLEKAMEDLQEQKGYSDDLIYSVTNHWTGGFYEDIQDYIKDGSLPEYYPDSVQEQIKKSANLIMDYIKDSDGLNVNTVLFRGGHWDIGMKVGEIGTTPLLNSTSYSLATAFDVGIEQSSDDEGNIPPTRYMINVYAPKGTKGMMVNAPSLSSTYPEHEYLLGKGQKYIVLDVDDESKIASILLINE